MFRYTLFGVCVGGVSSLSIYYLSHLQCRPHVLFQFIISAISFIFLPNSSFNASFPLVRCAKLITFVSRYSVLCFLFALLIQASHTFLCCNLLSFTFLFYIPGFNLYVLSLTFHCTYPTIFIHLLSKGWSYGHCAFV